MRLADSHCHLSHIEEEGVEVVAEARAAGVELIIDVGMGVEASRACAEHASALDGVYASVGIHPNDLADFERDPSEAMASLGSLASLAHVVAVGETGLDFYRDRSAPQLQEQSFRAHIDLAKESNRTLVIHCREAHRRVMDVLEEEGPPDRVVMHCFSGGTDEARECGEKGYYCSFAGNLTYKRSEELREAARVVPQRLLLVETDAPFLAPVPLRGKPSRPSMVVHTAEALAGVLGTGLQEIGRVLTDNTRHAFAL